MTKETIRSAAEALFMQKGIQATSLADVALAAGISKGTLFYHYKSKDDLIMDIACAHVQAISEEAFRLLNSYRATEQNPETVSLDKTTIRTTEVKNLLEVFIRSILDSKLRNRLHLYLIEESLTRNPSLKDTLNKKYMEWQNLMTSALDFFLGDKAGQYAPLLLACTDGLIIQSSLSGHNPPIRQLLDVLLPD